MIKTGEGDIPKEVAMARNRQSAFTGFLGAPEFQADAISIFASYMKRLDWNGLSMTDRSDAKTVLNIEKFTGQR